MGAYGKLTRGHEEAIYELRKKGRKGREIVEALARGVPGERPVSISVDRALKVGRRMVEERDDLYSTDVQHVAESVGVRVLCKRLLMVAEKETIRMERAQRVGRLDANKLGRLAHAMVRLDGLVRRLDEGPREPQPRPDGGGAQGNGSAVPSGFASSLIDGSGGGEPAPVADVPQAGPLTKL